MVLYPNGQRSTRARSEVLQQHLPRPKCFAVFTKYDQFFCNVKMDVLDDPDKYPDRSVSEVAEERFYKHYLLPLGENVGYVQLEKMHKTGGHCIELIEKTAIALNQDAITLMLLSLQKDNVELSVKTAWRCVHCLVTFEVEHVIRECLFAFPYIWVKPEKSESSSLGDLLLFLEKLLSLDEELSELELLESLSMFSFLEPMTKHIMALHTIQNLITHKSSNLHLIIAVILILKHATFLQLSNSPELALTYAELGYQRANIDVIIQQYLTACASEQSVEQFVGFIMGTDIVSSQSSTNIGS